MKPKLIGWIYKIIPRKSDAFDGMMEHYSARQHKKGPASPHMPGNTNIIKHMKEPKETLDNLKGSRIPLEGSFITRLLYHDWLQTPSVQRWSPTSSKWRCLRVHKQTVDILFWELQLTWFSLVDVTQIAANLHQQFEQKWSANTGMQPFLKYKQHNQNTGKKKKKHLGVEAHPYSLQTCSCIDLLSFWYLFKVSLKTFNNSDTIKEPMLFY